MFRLQSRSTRQPQERVRCLAGQAPARKEEGDETQGQIGKETPGSIVKVCAIHILSTGAF